MQYFPTKSLLLAVVAAAVSMAAMSLGLEIDEVEPYNHLASVSAGEPVHLSCKSDTQFQSCTWRHVDTEDKCTFEWEADQRDVRRIKCDEHIDRKIKFAGDYAGHVCAINIHTGEDAEDVEGEWTCEMTQYGWGVPNANTNKPPAKRTFRVEINASGANANANAGASLVAMLIATVVARLY